MKRDSVYSVRLLASLTGWARFSGQDSFYYVAAAPLLSWIQSIFCLLTLFPFKFCWLLWTSVWYDSCLASTDLLYYIVSYSILLLQFWSCTSDIASRLDYGNCKLLPTLACWYLLRELWSFFHVHTNLYDSLSLFLGYGSFKWFRGCVHRGELTRTFHSKANTDLIPFFFVVVVVHSVAFHFWQAIIKKRPSRNINVQNFWLYVFGMAFNAVAIVIQDFDAVANK